jgi:hypothetical protein
MIDNALLAGGAGALLTRQQLELLQARILSPGEIIYIGLLYNCTHKNTP